MHVCWLEKNTDTILNLVDMKINTNLCLKQSKVAFYNFSNIYVLGIFMLWYCLLHYSMVNYPWNLPTICQFNFLSSMTTKISTEDAKYPLIMELMSAVVEKKWSKGHFQEKIFRFKQYDTPKLKIFRIWTLNISFPFVVNVCILEKCIEE